MKAYFASTIVTEKDSLPDAYLLEDQGFIAGIVREPPSGIPVEAYKDCILAPGLIDVHTHGALGYETGFGSIEDLRRWSDFQLSHGVTGFLPTTASIPLERIRQAADDVKYLAAQPLSNIWGLQMEGPFFAPTAKIGAQNPQYVRAEFGPEYKDFISEYREVIKYIAIDPVLKTAEAIVAFCAGLGIRIAAAHSMILYQDFMKCKRWGFSAVTHTFNGMVGLDHRHPGLAYAACMDRDLYGEIICDGYHVNYSMIELFLQLKGYQRAILVTDSMGAAGMPPGSYTLGDIHVNVSSGGKVTKADGGLAGSVLTMDQAVRNLVNHLNIPLHEAFFMASSAPAAMLGIDRFKGGVGIHKEADFIILDSDLNVMATYMKGRNLFKAGNAS